MRIVWLRVSKGDNISVRRERIAEHLEEMGHEVTIVDSSWLDAIPAAFRVITGGYDVIAGNVRMGLFVGYPLSRLLRKPFLGDVSDPQTDIEYLPGPLYRFFCWLEWTFLARADASVFVYESSFREAKLRGIEGRKLPNVVDFDRFESPASDIVAEARSILESDGVDLQQPVATYVGGFSPNYHIAEIIEAARLRDDWEFVFIGEGRLERTVVDAADNLENVHYPGAFRYELMPGFLALSDVGFCFKDAEQPLKLKEYAAAGLPVIAQPGELSRWYDDEQLVFTQPTPSEIDETLDRLRVEGTRERYARNLREAVDGRDWEDIAREYNALFERIVDA